MFGFKKKQFLEFDPLHPSMFERQDMKRGWKDGQAGALWPADPSLAYTHGRNHGHNAKTGRKDAEQARLVERARSEWMEGKFGRKEGRDDFETTMIMNVPRKDVGKALAKIEKHRRQSGR